MKERTAIYPGSFDPITNGHVDIVCRGLKLFDKIIIAVGVNTKKQGLFTRDERVQLIKEVFKEYPAVSVETFDGLLTNFMYMNDIKFAIRGLRALSDFEAEFQMALLNHKMYHKIESVFLMTDESHLYISSSAVKEIAAMGGCVVDFVPGCVQLALLKKYRSSLEKSE